MLALLCWFDKWACKIGNAVAPAIDLTIRVYLAQVFFKSGLTKIANWDSTVSLFKYEYSVPLLPPEIAAYLGTVAELVLPVLLLIGLGSRIAPFMLFVFNIVAVVSYPFLFTANGVVGLHDHIVWGLLLAMLCGHGYGKWSLDYLLGRWLCKHS